MIFRIPKAVILNQRVSLGVILVASACFSLLLFGFSLNKFQILAPVFFGDHNVILDFAKTTTEWAREGYPNTGFLYQKLGLADSVDSVVIFSFIVCLGVFTYMLIIAPVVDFTALVILLLFLSFSSVFLQQYSKDFFVLFIVMSMVMFGLKTKLGLVIFVATGLLYAYYFRNYWFLVFANYFGFVISFHLLKIPATRFKVLLVSCLFILVLSIAFEIVLDVGLSHYRRIINISRVGDVNATSIILPFIPVGNFFLEWINGLITLIMMLFPIKLLALGGLQHVASFIAISFISLNFFRDMEDAMSDHGGKHAVFFVVSFVLVQMTFEPDYSSFLRHLTPLLPLVLVSHYKACMLRSQ
ncbi:hypothetical protein N9161_03950 [Porticoccaceae bacterium]|nr:hypothetical protein [Porticoccaceae bacterium]